MVWRTDGKGLRKTYNSAWLPAAFVGLYAALVLTRPVAIGSA